MRFIDKLLILGVATLTPFTSFSQEKKDTVAGFNAMNYLVQKRFRNSNMPFKNKSIFSHMYMQIGVGASYILPYKNIKYDMIKDIHLGLGKEFSPYHSIRLGFDYGATHKTSNQQELRLMTGSLDYAFNLSSYIYGYNPLRKFEVLPTFGVGYTKSTYMEKDSESWDFHLGTQLKFIAGTDAYVSLEPQIAIATDEYDHSKTRNWRGLDYRFGGLINYSYYFKSLLEGYKDVKANANDNTYFVETGMGVQAQNISGMDIAQTTGVNYTLGFGKMYYNGLGFRFSTDFSTNNYRQLPYNNIRTTESYSALRAEILVDPFSLFKSKNISSSFGTNIALGAAYGHLHKYNYNAQSSFNYLGYTGGVQGWVKLQDGLKLFVEPHALFVVDYYTPNDVSTKYRKNTDVLYNVDLGLHMEYGSKDSRAANKKNNFEPRGFVQVGGGIGNYFWSKKYNAGGGSLDFNAGIAGGYRFTSLHGIKGELNLNRVSFNQYNNGQIYGRDGYFASLSANYMFNVLNALQGFDSERRFGVDAYLGPVVGYLLFDRSRSIYIPSYEKSDLTKRLDKKLFYGGQIGLQLGYRLSDQFGVYVAPEAMLIKHNSDNTIFAQNLNDIFRVNAGVEYTFADGEEFMEGLFPSEVNEASGLNTPFFLEYGMGMSMQRFGSLKINESTGPSYNFAIGKWFSPVIGLRMEGNASFNNVEKRTSAAEAKAGIDSYYRDGHALGGLDLLVNPIGGKDGYQFNSNAGFHVFGGVNGGWVVGGGKRAITMGMSVGAQGWVRLQKGIDLFVEPRMGRYTYKANNNRYYYNSFGGNIGIRMDYMKPSERTAEGRGGSLDNKYIFAQIEGGLGMRVTRHFSKWDQNQLNSDWGVALGYRYSNLSAVRGSFDIYSYNSMATPTYTSIKTGKKASARALQTERNANIFLDYMFNMNTFLKGYSNDDMFDVYAFAGPGLVLPMKTTYDLERGKNGISLSDVSIPEVENKFTVAGRAGFLFNCRMTSNFGIYFSPQLRVNYRRNTDGVSFPHKIMPMLMYNAGVSYRFNGENNQLYTNSVLQHQSEMADLMAPVFFEASMGVQMHNSAKRLEHIQTMGPRYTFTVGKWFVPAIGAKASAVVSIGKWNYVQNQTNMTTAAGYTGANVKVMVNPFAFMTSYNDETPVGLNISFGPEFGHARRYYASGDVKTTGWQKGTYQGWGVGMQLWARCSAGNRLFVEPYYTYGRYNYKYTTARAKQLGASVGMSMDYVAKSDRTDDEAYFNTGMFAQLSVGSNYMIDAYHHKDDPHVLPAVSLDLGYRFNSMSGVRFGFGYNTYNTNSNATKNSSTYIVQRKLNYITASAAYQLNLSTLFQGTDKDRKLQAEMFVGPSILKPQAETVTVKGGSQSDAKVYGDTSMKVGAVAGLQLSYNVSDNVSLNFTPECQVYNNSQAGKSAFGLHHIPFFKTSVGVGYNF